MCQYIQDSFRWLRLCFLRPITLEEVAKQLSVRTAVKIFFQVLPLVCTIILAAEGIVWMLYHFMGYQFNWSGALIVMTVFGPSAWLVVWVRMGLIAGLSAWLVVWLGMVIIGLSIWMTIIWLSAGLLAGLCVGVVVGLAFWGAGLKVLLFTWPGVGLIAWLGVGMNFALGYIISFIFIYTRAFYLLFYTFQYWRAKQADDPFINFRRSSVHWDETIRVPLPYLADWLVSLTNHDRESGLTEVFFVAENSPFQRRAVQKALIVLTVEELKQVDSLEKMARGSEILRLIPPNAGHFLQSSRGLIEVRRYIESISRRNHELLTQVTPLGRANILKELREELQSFRDTMMLVEPAVGMKFHPFAIKWLKVVDFEETENWKRMAFTFIRNPFIYGNPIQPKDHGLLRGREDIMEAIKQHLTNTSQRPALFLYGRRRIGKTSTLLNLPVLLGSHFYPIFVDCQNSAWVESDQAFCYNLSRAIFDNTDKEFHLSGLSEPRLEQFEKNPFTMLGDLMNQTENLYRLVKKQCLITFDEYENLEEGIKAGKITRNILNQIRNIVQHRQQIVVLFSGSHRFEEMKTVNWSDYMINVKTLELSCLSPRDAEDLIRHPNPEFSLQYGSGVVERILALTRRHPYLLQALASDLVDYLNLQRRVVATADDLGVAIEKVLVSAQVYFFYTWSEDCSEKERLILKALATSDTGNVPLDTNSSEVQSLCQKEILERSGNRCGFTVDLFRRWILKTHGSGKAPERLQYC